MDARPSTNLWGRTIYLNEIYFVCYGENADEMRKELNQPIDDVERLMADPAYKKYYLIRDLLPMFHDRALVELPPANNPHTIKVIGKVLVDICGMGWIPSFDPLFEENHKLVLMSLQNYENLLTERAARERALGK